MGSKLLFLDTETYNETPIKNGVYAYAETAEVMLLAYAFGDDFAKVIDLTNGEAIPEPLLFAMTDPSYIKVFHNSLFDRNVMKHALGIDIPVSQIHDTMVQAYQHSLPGALATLCKIYKLDETEAKSSTGKNLIQLFCKPLGKNQKLERATSQTHPKEWNDFLEYAVSDIVAMRVLYNKMPKLNCKGTERFLWELDQRINDRGFYVDIDLATKAVHATKKRQKKLADDVDGKTNGEVGSATQRDAMLAHILKAYGVDLPDLRKSTVEQRIQDPDLPQEVKELLMIRSKAATTSTAKYSALLRCASSDSRLRGGLQFCGASRTGRWAGRLFQPQNLPRPSHKQSDIDAAIEWIKADAIEMLDPDDVMGLVSSSLRGVIAAPEGKKLVVSDLSNIEGRVAAWLANEDWKLEAFRDFDSGTGPDLYKLAYAKSFRIKPEDVTKDQRQIGKVQELALQYGGGVGAFMTFATAYGIDLDELGKKAWPNLPEPVKEECRNMYGWWKDQHRDDYGLSQNTFMAMDGLKRLWRNAHPHISEIWSNLEVAALAAVENPEKVYSVGKLAYVCKTGYLYCKLPSGRYMVYPSPRVKDNQLTYMGTHQYSRKVVRLSTYGGKLFENVTQAVARDVMAHSFLEAENAGYEIVLSVHDELITEVPDLPEYSEAGLSRIMSTQPDWCKNLPLASGGFEGYRYRKD
jgi:DNA polymerase bacteriophage-type